MTTVDRTSPSVGPRSIPSAAFRIERRGPVVTASGEIDAYAAMPLHEELSAGPVEVIDLSAVTFFSAAGVGVLVACGRGCPTDPVVHTSPAVDRVLRLCGPDGFTPPGD